MEFVRESEVEGLLRDHGIRKDPIDGDHVYLRMSSADGITKLHLSTDASEATPEEGARVVPMPADRLPDAIEEIVQTLHLSDVVLVPVGKWRSVFDAVAFSLAENEDWQRFDATATVELNTRDPLLCGPPDLHTLSALIKALLTDADDPSQGLMMTSTGAPLLIELVPDGAFRVSFGNQVLADEVSDALG